MDKKLSKEARKVYCKLYRRFLEEKEKGVEDFEAMHFGSFHDISEDFLPKKARIEVAESLKELEEAGYLEAVILNDLPYEVNLTKKGLTLMDSTFDCKIEQITDYLKNLVSN